MTIIVNTTLHSIKMGTHTTAGCGVVVKGIESRGRRRDGSCSFDGAEVRLSWLTDLRGRLQIAEPAIVSQDKRDGRGRKQWPSLNIQLC